MAKVPRTTGRELVAFPERRGFHVTPIKGSHHFMEGGDRRTSVPVHGHQTLKIGTLYGILRDIGMSTGEFANVWNE